MANILFVILLLFIKKNNLYEAKDYIFDQTNSIEPGISRTFYIEYIEQADFTFKTNQNDPLQINIRSINCKIKVFSSNKTVIQSSSNELYYILINSDNKTIFIKPVMDTTDDVFNEKYELKKCFLSINSYHIINGTQPHFEIANKEENYLFSDISKYSSLHISYNITKAKTSIDSFVALNFRFEGSSYKIDILYTNNINQNKSMSKNINSPTYIYLDNEFFSNNNSNEEGTLYINITNNKKENTSIIFKIIEEDNVCLLAKNSLNFGFITSKSTYQYYYAEILSEDEGEFMLHNKRTYGVLYAKFVEKKNIVNINDLYNNISLYPHRNETDLKYNEHKLQLKFNYEENDLERCVNGCYILMTYEQIKSEEEFPLIGYEYTFLSRTWNYTDGYFKIIEIFPNEYIVGCYDIQTILIHLYFIQIPKNTEQIIIQIDGSYIEALYKLSNMTIINSWYQKGFKEIDLYNNKNITIIDKVNITTNYIIFLFNDIETYNITFSQYYFRVLFVTSNEKTKYLPIDSNLGNLCLPNRKSNEEPYYCYFILKNDYNELNFTKFAISSENRNEYVKIKTSIKYTNETTEYKGYTNFTYVYDKKIDNIDYILFTFEFSNNETKNIISAFSDRIIKIYPQVYSGQMCYLDKFTKLNNLRYTNDYFLKYQFVYGDSGIYNYSIEKYDYIKISQNFKGKSIIIPLDQNFSFYTNNAKHIFYYQLVNNLELDLFEEVKEGDPLIRVLKEYYFPLYYFIKIKNKKYANMDVNVGFKIYSESPQQINAKLGIKGYIINEKILNRMQKEGYTQLENAIDGNYSDAFGIGFLEVNQEIDNNTDNYLLIEISSLDRYHSYKDTISSVEISYKEFDDENNNTNYSLPVNKYIIESIYDKNNQTRNENKYRIYKTEDIKNQILIEISTENDDIKIEFEDGLIYENANNNAKERGFKKYLINDTINREINFKVKNYGEYKSNYLIKYSYYDIDEKKSFIFNDNNFKVSGDNVTFNFIQVDTSSELLKRKGTCFFITGTLYNASDTSDKSINSNYILNEINSPYINKTIHFYNSTLNNSWTLEFKNVPKDRDCNFDLQLQILALPLDNFLNEEYLLYKKGTVLVKTIEEKKDKKLIYIAIFVPIGAIILALALFFLIKYFKLKKKNDSFKQEMKSLLFSNDIQKNVLIHEQQLSKNDSDYENTFI